MKTKMKLSWILPLACVAIFSLLTGCSSFPETHNSDSSGSKGFGSSKLEVGASCQQNSDCGKGGCLAGMPGGYCSLKCSQSDICPVGSSCTEANDGSSFCLKRCDRTSDCRTDYVCMRMSGKALCMPKCQNDAGCNKGTYCDQHSGVCKIGVPTRGKRSDIGNACQRGENCQQNLCITSDDGYCTANCSNTACSQGSTCVSFNQQKKLCMVPCQEDRDCRGNQRCIFAPDRKKVCAPPGIVID